MAYLVINDGSEKGNRIDLTGAAEVFIGRSADKSDVVIPSGSVSGRHCSLARGDDCFVIKDLDSTNGSFLNGTKFTGEQKVYRSDNIVLGDVQMVLLGDDVPARPDPNAAEGGDAPAVQKTTQVKAPSTQPAAPRPLSGSPVLNMTASETVKVLPLSFKKKKRGGAIWTVLIFLLAILAIYLIFVLVQTTMG